MQMNLGEETQRLEKLGVAGLQKRAAIAAL